MGIAMYHILYTNVTFLTKNLFYNSCAQPTENHFLNGQNNYDAVTCNALTSSTAQGH